MDMTASENSHHHHHRWYETPSRLGVIDHHQSSSPSAASNGQSNNMGAGSLDPNSLLGATNSGASAGSDHQADMTASAMAEHMSSLFATHHPGLATVTADGAGAHHQRAAAVAARYYQQHIHHSPYAPSAASHGEL
jgi:hypothetical protein